MRDSVGVIIVSEIGVSIGGVFLQSLNGIVGTEDAAIEELKNKMSKSGF